MNLIEEAIAAVAPGWAVRRARNRFVLDEVRKYEAAKAGRHTAGWSVQGTSANAEIGPALDVMRNRSRDLVRNNPVAASAIRQTASNMVGKGIVPRTMRGTGKAAIDRWATFVSGADPEGLSNFYGQQRLIARTVAESGEALLRWYYRPVSSEFASPVQCQVLEADFLDTGRTEQLNNGNTVIQGVEFDRQGRRVAYWLFDQHPGETSIARWKSYVSQRVPADEISPVFDILRPGQVRGVPWLAPVVTGLRDLDDYEFAERLRKKMAACFSVFVKKEDAGAVGTLETEAETGRRREKVAPGQITYLRPGEDVSFGSPQGAEGYGEYLVMQLHLIAAGTGHPYHQLTGDLRQANYSSLREGKLMYWGLIDQWQDFMLVPQACAPAWSRVQRAAGRVAMPYWQRPARAWVDPQKEANAEDLQMENATKSWKQAVLERGQDPEQLLDEIEEFAPRLKAVGVDLFSRNPASADQAVGNDGSVDEPQKVTEQSK